MQFVLVYSVGSSVLDDVKGVVQKAVGKGSVCALCNMTYGVATMKPEWREFVGSLENEPIVYHSDEIPQDVQVFLDSSSTKIPVVLEKLDEGYRVLITKSELDSCNKDVACLITKLKAFL